MPKQYIKIRGASEHNLKNIDIEIPREKLVVITGVSGSGKSTLLNAIINNEMLSEGIGDEKFNIYKEGSPVIGYLRQMDFEDDSITMLDEILKVYKEQLEIEMKLEKLVEKMQEDSSEDLAKEFKDKGLNYIVEYRKGNPVAKNLAAYHEWGHQQAINNANPEENLQYFSDLYRNDRLNEKRSKAIEYLYIADR